MFQFQASVIQFRCASTHSEVSQDSQFGRSILASTKWASMAFPQPAQSFLGSQLWSHCLLRLSSSQLVLLCLQQPFALLLKLLRLLRFLLKLHLALNSEKKLTLTALYKTIMIYKSMLSKFLVAYYNRWQSNECPLPDIVVRPWQGYQLQVIMCFLLPNPALACQYITKLDQHVFLQNVGSHLHAQL